ncbi:MAG TPA: molybdopterin-dependent oxidoreductase [Actinomycetota bacterium]|nr:molybdopterin-dependent oxidoreductase [Actinomycetota bacterium]
MNREEASEGPRIDRREARIAGALGAAVALSVMWLIASILASARFAPEALGDLFIRGAPGDLATFFIESLDHWALRILIALVLIGSVLAGGEILWRTSSNTGLRNWSAAGIIGTAGIAAITFGPAAGTNRIASSVVVVIGAVVYAFASSAVHRSIVAPLADPTRRQTFRLAVGGAGALALAGGIVGWLLRRLSGPDRDVELVAPAVTATVPDRPAWPKIPGLTPEITATEDHYVVDIDLFSPSVEAEGWVLSIGGMVDSPMELAFSQLQDRFEVVEEYSVLVCVSNEVGGDLIGHSAWGGVRLAEVLEAAGMNEEAVDVVFTGADGYTDSIPLEAALAPTTLLAVSQNGSPLEQDHGFPCRVRVPSIYGMKNVKWLESIELVGKDFNGYWAQRGWSDEAIIKTESRIDVPQDRASVPSGQETWIAGIAWAGDRGVSKVEVSLDDGSSWEEAMLKEPIAANSWHQWAYRWTPETSGGIELFCRATDGEGKVQTEETAPPHPAGASGYHSVSVQVS